MFSCRHIAVVIAACTVASCGDETETDAPLPVTEEAPTFEDSPYRYCQKQKERWLSDILERINRSLPEYADTRYEELHIQNAWRDGLRVAGKKDLVLRVTAQAGEVSDQRVMAIGMIDPNTCDVPKLRGKLGWDVYGDEESWTIE